MSATETLDRPAAQAEVKGGVVPYICVSDASAASAFYQQAFAAEEVSRATAPGDTSGKLCHLHLYVNGGSLMLMDAYPERGCNVHGGGFNLTLEVKDIDAWFERAVKAGAKPIMPVQPMFWGARWGLLEDPFGVQWSLNETPAQA